ncbi:MAG TPA: hypothetical protein ENF41_04450 [Candidatus Bathyarchaeota archaeon]|nr:hypothetical protein [Candidatus Bathyarchaeota archaeon]
MISFLQYVFEVISISMTGTLSPGPLTAALISWGSRKGWRAGLYASIGHTIVEFPLVVGIAMGIYLILEEGILRILGMIGGILLLFMGVFQIVRREKERREEVGRALGVGILLTGLNPYFIIWWFAIGVRIISTTVILFGFAGILLMYVLHVWLDYVWMILVSELSYRGCKLWGKLEVILKYVTGILMILFGLFFIMDALQQSFLVP